MINEKELNKNEIRLVDYIIIILISLLCFGYLGVLRSFQSYISIAALGIMGMLILSGKYPLKKISAIWGVLYFYIIINVMTFNSETGIKYIIMFTVGLILVMLSGNLTFYLKLMDVIQTISVVFAIATLVNSQYPEIIITFFGFMIPYEQLETIRENIMWGGFPGLAGELSYNAFCITLGMSVAFSKIIAFKKSRLLNSILLIIMFIAIVLTAKRSFMLIVPCTALLILTLVMYSGKGWKKIFFAVFFLSLPLIYEMFAGELVNGLLNKGQDTIDLSNRDFFWKIAIDMIKQRPIFGNGINTYDLVFNKITGHIGYAGAHNSYLQITAELGIFGALIYFGIIFSLLFHTCKVLAVSVKNNYQKEMYLILVSLFMQIVFICYALSGNPFYQQQQLYTYFLYAGIAIQMIYKEKREVCSG